MNENEAGPSAAEPVLLVPTQAGDLSVGGRFMVKPAWRWRVYTVGPYGSYRLVGKTWRFVTAERWVRL